LRRREFVAAASGLVLAPRVGYAAPSPAPLDVRIVTDEAEAALAIAAGATDDAAVARLIASEGYVRLKAREHALKRDIVDAEFVAFVQSETVRNRLSELTSTLNDWRNADLRGAAAKALAYLPADSRLRASIYLEIKPRPNSFVFDLDTNPGIFLYLDPAVPKALFENTVAHELHHVGSAQNCPPAAIRPALDALPPQLKLLRKWLSAFGEGFAVLAAAGGPDVHPHAVDTATARERWDRDIKNWQTDLVSLATFLNRILDGTLSGDAADKEGFTFFGDAQGPWYTVGWSMACAIERRFGRARLIESICDIRRFIPSYNAAVRGTPGAAPGPLWPERLATAFGP
jgi:hypothetical protein